MNEYKEAFEQFNDTLSEGQTICNGEEITIYGARQFYDVDEDMAEESFSNYLDSEGLEILVSLEDCLFNDVSYTLEDQVLNSFINGQFKQFIDQFSCLNDPHDFLDYIKGDDQEKAILRHLVREAY